MTTHLRKQSKRPPRPYSSLPVTVSYRRYHNGPYAMKKFANHGEFKKWFLQNLGKLCSMQYAVTPIEEE